MADDDIQDIARHLVESQTPRYHYVRITDNDSDVLPVCDYCGCYVAESEPHDKYHSDVTGIVLMLTEIMVRMTLELKKDQP
jgi:hypothetical protein